ncbi:MAG: LacI family DNA-binding transcriptional regulator [Chloroflexota bacterium]
MKKRVTVDEVAKKAGVSMMTVSRAINNKDGVGEKTRQRVLQIANEMGYRPSNLARSLATDRTATIGLIVPDISNPFFSQIAHGVETLAFEAGYTVFLLNTDENVDREIAVLNSLWEKRVDGMILCSSRLEQADLVERLTHFPAIVLINRQFSAEVNNVCTFNIDDQQVAKLAIDHLVATGHKNIAFIAGPQHSVSSQERLKGYQESLAAHGLQVKESYIEHCTPNTDGGYSAAAKLLKSHHEISAFFAFNDLTATGVIRACTDLHLQVPDDVAVIGVDDIPLASLVTPALSTIRIDKRKLGASAMNMLTALMDGKQIEKPQQNVLPKLIVRQSTVS